MLVYHFWLHTKYSLIICYYRLSTQCQLIAVMVQRVSLLFSRSVSFKGSLRRKFSNVTETDVKNKNAPYGIIKFQTFLCQEQKTKCVSICHHFLFGAYCYVVADAVLSNFTLFKIMLLCGNTFLQQNKIEFALTSHSITMYNQKQEYI